MTYNELAELLKQEGGELEVSFKVISQNEVVFGNNNPYKDVITFKNDDIKWYSDKEQPVNEDLEEAMQQNAPNNIGIDDLLYWRNGFITGVKWKEK